MRCSSRIDAICKASVISVLGLPVGTEKKVFHISCIHEWGNWQTHCNHYTLPLEGFYTSPLMLVRGGKPNITLETQLIELFNLSALAMIPTGICHNLDLSMWWLLTCYFWMSSQILIMMDQFQTFWQYTYKKLGSQIIDECLVVSVACDSSSFWSQCHKCCHQFILAS